MPRFQVNSDAFLHATPAGAYYAVCDPNPEPARDLLFRLLMCEEAPRLTLDLLRRWLAAGSDDSALELVHRMHSLGWIQGETAARQAPVGMLESILPDRLAKLSSTSRVLLADSAGFYVANVGFTHETAEEVSALTGALATVHERYRGLLHRNLGISSAACAVVNSSGNSEIGFWPLFIGHERFVLALTGVPQLNQPAFTEVVWALAKRYAVQEDGPEDTRDAVSGSG